MRTALFALCLLTCAGVAPADATETADGQITCIDLDSMREYVKALASGDRQWVDQVKGCLLSISGSKMVIIDRDIPSGGIPNVARVRVFRRDGEASIIVYVILEQGQ